MGPIWKVYKTKKKSKVSELDTSTKQLNNDLIKEQNIEQKRLQKEIKKSYKELGMIENYKK